MQSFRTFLEEGDVVQGDFKGLSTVLHLRNAFGHADPKKNPHYQGPTKWDVQPYHFDRMAGVETDSFSAHSTSTQFGHQDAVQEVMDKIKQHGGVVTQQISGKHEPHDQQTKTLQFVDTNRNKCTAVIRTTDHGFGYRHQVHVIQGAEKEGAR